MNYIDMIVSKTREAYSAELQAKVRAREITGTAIARELRAINAKVANLRASLEAAGMGAVEAAVNAKENRYGV